MESNEEQLMVAIKAHVLQEKQAFLCENLNPKDHYPYLRSKSILSRDDEELIENEPTRKRKAHLFIDILTRKGPTAYDELVRSLLVDRTQIFIAEALNKLFEEKKSSLMALLQSNRIPATGTPAPTVVHKAVPTSTDKHTSVSDLGVDTDLLPKPSMKDFLQSGRERSVNGKSSTGKSSTGRGKEEEKSEIQETFVSVEPKDTGKSDV